MNGKKRSMAFSTSINLISGIGVMITNICVSFFLSPYIIENIGIEANGFVSLANNFVAYADLIVTALNAMAARFITIAYVKEDYKKANLYYNSVFWGNWIIVAVLLIPAVCLITHLQSFVDIPADILFDVKVLFSLAFFGFFVKTAAPNWDCGTYISNRMDRTYVPNMVTALFRCVFLFCVFTIWTPRIWYVGLSSTIVTLVTLGVAGYNTHTLTPELRIQFKKPICSCKVIKELVGSGIWNSLASAGNTLMNSLDLLVCNMFIGATEMGILSLSKSLPSIMSTFSETMRGAFGPELTIAYAKEDKERVLSCLKRAMKIMSVAVNIPAAGIVVMSDALYRLWVPSQDAELLRTLTVLAVLNYLITSGTAVMNNVFTTVNKVKVNSIALMITGGASIFITFLFIRFSNLGIYAVAGVSSIVMIIKNIVFMLPVTSKMLGFKWYQFYPLVGTSILSSAMIIAIGIIVRIIIPIDSWGTFFAACFCIGGIGLVLNLMIVLNRDERQYFLSMIKRRLKK